jgi:alpha-mannosidase
VGEEPHPQPLSRVALGPAGGITGFAGPDGTPLLASAVGFVVVEDKSNAWGMGAPHAFDRELGRPTWISSTLTNEGPVRRVWTQKAVWRSSTITVDVTETFGDDIVGISVFADWHEAEEILMLEIPTVFAPETHFAKVAGATMVRHNTGDEEPGQDWVALEGDIGGARYTLALVNAQTYSYNCKGGRLRTVIVRSAPWTRDYEHSPNQDIGYSIRRFGLMGFKGSVLSLGLERRALEFQTPLEYMVDSVHPGTEPWERSFLEIVPGNVSVTAIKHAESGNALIVRLQETVGTGTVATIRSSMANWSHTVSLAPWSIVTVAIANPGSSHALLSRIDALEWGLT